MHTVLRTRIRSLTLTLTSIPRHGYLDHDCDPDTLSLTSTWTWMSKVWTWSGLSVPLLALTLNCAHSTVCPKNNLAYSPKTATTRILSASCLVRQCELDDCSEIFCRRQSRVVGNPIHTAEADATQTRQFCLAWWC